MSEDKEIQKVPKYSIDDLSAQSHLAKRGLRELEPLKDKNHSRMIIYVCQFCGRLIGWSSAPCVFCSNYPKTKREVVIAQALSSRRLEIGQLIVVSKAVKAKRDLELIVVGLREQVDDILENESKYPLYKTLFTQIDFYTNNKRHTLEYTDTACQNCGHNILIGNSLCLYCASLEDGLEDDSKSSVNSLSPTEKRVVALNRFLLFVESDLNFEESKWSVRLINWSVFIICHLIRKNELSNKDVWFCWKVALLKTRTFKKNKNLRVEIYYNEAKAFMDEDVSSKERLITLSLCSSLTFLLKQNI